MHEEIYSTQSAYRYRCTPADALPMCFTRSLAGLFRRGSSSTPGVCPYSGAGVGERRGTAVGKGLSLSSPCPATRRFGVTTSSRSSRAAWGSLGG